MLKITEKQKMQNKIKSDIDQFIKNGGKIQVIPEMTYYEIKDKYKLKNSLVFNKSENNRGIGYNGGLNNE